MTETAHEPAATGATRPAATGATPPAATEATPPAADDTSPSGAQHVNVTALFAEAASKSGLLWVDVPGDRAWPFWHAWTGETVYAVSGPGEQSLPWLPDEVRLIARSKDSGGRLLSVHAAVRAVGPDDPDWDTAVEVLKGGRLNATDDLEARWREVCTVRAFTPYGAPVEAPGTYSATSGAAPVPASEATTAHWRPWHWRGRPTRRRGTRLPDER